MRTGTVPAIEGGLLRNGHRDLLIFDVREEYGRIPASDAGAAPFRNEKEIGA